MKGTESAFIDGAETFYVKETPRIHPEVRLTALACLPVEGAAIDTRIDGKNSTERLEIFIEELAPRIRSWSLDRPPTVENLHKMKRDLVYRLVNIVLWGLDGGDIDPGTTQELKDAIQAAQLAKKNGVATTVTNELERAHQGN